MNASLNAAMCQCFSGAAKSPSVLLWVGLYCEHLTNTACLLLIPHTSIAFTIEANRTRALNQNTVKMYYWFKTRDDFTKWHDAFDITYIIVVGWYMTNTRGGRFPRIECMKWRMESSTHAHFQSSQIHTFQRLQFSIKANADEPKSSFLPWSFLFFFLWYI